MKKLVLILSLSSLVSLQAMDANVLSNATIWKGAPAALRNAAQDHEVITALQSLGTSVTNLMHLYIKKLEPALNAEQKKQCASLLEHVRKMMHKTYDLSQQNGDSTVLQQELQTMGQQLFFSYFPLLITMQQEMTDQVAAKIQEDMKEFTAQGFAVLDNAIDSMIQTLQ